jgi:transcriptional repressor NrdR
MRCPYCGHEDSQVKDSRPTEDGAAIRRRRQCEDCGARFTTFERIQLREVSVLKAGGGREPFDREKLMRSIQIACRKLETSGENEVQAAQIGAMVMEALKGFDSVAYIRFASVYREFTEARDFEEFASSVTEAAHKS